MSFLLSLLTSRAGLATLAVALVLGVIGVQSARLGHAKSDLTRATASLKDATKALTTSETRRDAEYRKALSDADEASRRCSERVAEALRSGSAIRSIVSKPHVTDPKTGCPVRSLVPAGELRAAVQP